MFQRRDSLEAQMKRLELENEHLQAEIRQMKRSKSILESLNPILEKATTTDTYYKNLLQYISEVARFPKVDKDIIKEYLEAILKGCEVEVFIGTELFSRMFLQSDSQIGYNPDVSINDLYESTGFLKLETFLANTSLTPGLINYSPVTINNMGLGHYRTCSIYVMPNLLEITPGFIVFLDRRRTAFSPVEKEMINLFMDLIQPVINNQLVISLLKEEVENATILAETDALTGIGNRGKFNKDYLNNNDRIKDYLIYLDLCKLKFINDNYGHDIADNVLKDFAEQIKSFAERLGGSGYRLGGDEFIAVIPSVHTKTTLEREVKTFQEKFESTEYLSHTRDIFKCNTSIGVFDNSELEYTTEGALKRADDLMYKSKKETHDIVFSWKMQN